ncbi:MAG: zinc ABC transporter substrate-binding protein [Spirochaetales bacterium]
MLRIARLSKDAVFAGIVFLFALLPLSAGGRKEAPKEVKVETAKPVVAVSILPQSYFVKRIGGDTATILTLVGPGQSPHTYEPSPRQMEELSRAKAWIRLSTEFDDRLKPKVASLYPNLLIVEGTAGVTFRTLEAHEHEEEHTKETDKAAHDKEKEKGQTHAEIEKDRHTWLGREPAKILASHVRDTLSKINPARSQEYQRNYQAFVQEIDSLFESLKKDLEPLKGKPVYVYHPAFGYFLDEFGIVQEAVETGGKEPNPQTLAKLIEKAKEDRVKVIFVQAQFPTQAAHTLARQLGAQVVPLDPLAPDWLDNIHRMGEALRKVSK